MHVPWVRTTLSALEVLFSSSNVFGVLIARSWAGSRHLRLDCVLECVQLYATGSLLQRVWGCHGAVSLSLPHGVNHNSCARKGGLCKEKGVVPTTRV